TRTAEPCGSAFLRPENAWAAKSTKDAKRTRAKHSPVVDGGKRSTEGAEHAEAGRPEAPCPSPKGKPAITHGSCRGAMEAPPVPHHSTSTTTDSALPYEHP